MMIKRSLNCENFLTREEAGEMHIAGYFSVFDSPYRISNTAYETVARGAFTDTLDGDVRALINHDTTLVLGRTTAGTLTLKEDEHGLYGDILINPNDQDAVNTYARVNRGDVSQCSFGFEILDESTEIREDTGEVHFTINKVRLFEVSVCTFPAYDETSVSARSAEAEEFRRAKELEAWKIATLATLKGGVQ